MSETRHNPESGNRESGETSNPDGTRTQRDSNANNNASTKLQVAGCSFCELAVNRPDSKLYFGIDRVKVDGDWVDRNVAIKLISLEGSRASERLQNYSQEIRAFHKVTNPHIVPLYRTLVSEKSIAFVMQRIEGPTLEESRKQIRWTLSMAVKLFGQLVEALTALHEQRIIHGDVHIGNVMLWKPASPQKSKSMHVYLLDFGLSRNEDQSTLTPAHDIRGLANIILMMLWPDGKVQTDPTRRLTNSLIWVLYKASREDCTYKTIDEFAEAFQKTLKRSYRPAARPRPRTPTPDITTQTAEMAQVAVETPSVAPKVIDSVLVKVQAVEPAAAPAIMADPQPIVAMQIRRFKTLWPWVVAAVVIVVGVILALLGMGSEAEVTILPQIGVVFDIRQERVVLMNYGTERMAHSYQNFPASVVAFSLNGEYLAAERAVLNRHTGRLVRMFDDQPMPVALALSADGAIMALHDGTFVRLLDVTNNILLHVLTGIHPDDVQTLFTPAGYSRLRTAIAGSRRESALAATR